MPAIVKYPAAQAHLAAEHFCRVCGRRAYPFLNGFDHTGFGPCPQGADNPVDCRDLRIMVVNAFSLAQQLGRPVHPETRALVDRLGIPDTVIAGWLARFERVAALRGELRNGTYGIGGPADFMPALSDWLSGDLSGERILLLIEEIRIAADPTEGGACEPTMEEIAAWHDDLGKRAREILSDPGEWEIGDDDE